MEDSARCPPRGGGLRTKPRHIVSEDDAPRSPGEGGRHKKGPREGRRRTNGPSPPSFDEQADDVETNLELLNAKVALRGCARAEGLITRTVDGGGATGQQVLLRNEAGLSVRLCDGLGYEEAGRAERGAPPSASRPLWLRLGRPRRLGDGGWLAGRS